MTKICLIEDDESLRDELARHLELQGYECIPILEFKEAARGLSSRTRIVSFLI